MLHRPPKRIIILAALLSAACSGDGGDGPPPTGPSNDMTWIDVSAGLHHTCGVSTQNAAYCWGSGSAGQLGTGETPATSPPKAVSGTLRFRAIGAGDDFSCGLTVDGQVYCWGSNRLNQLGDGTSTDRSVPVPVAGMTGIRDLFVGASGVYAVTHDDRRFCWGFGCREGGPSELYPVPVQVTSLPPLRGMASRGPHWCGASPVRGIACWGEGLHQSLGPTPPEFNPDRDYTIVMGGTSFRTAAAGYAHSCGLTSSGVVYCWGHNGYGQVGLGVQEPAADPSSGRAPGEPVSGVPAFTELFAGGLITCALAADGSAYCWGGNASGQVGAASSRPFLSAPTLVAGGHLFRKLTIGALDAAERQHVCGITVPGRLYCWGSGASGGAGPRVQQYATAPQEVDDPSVPGWVAN